MDLKVFVKAIAATLFFVVVLLSLTVGVVAWWSWGKVTAFTTPAQISVDELLATVVAGWYRTPTQTNNRVNFLILGLDTLELRTSPPLTDTMMLVSVDLNSGQISSLPFPRDLWNDIYQTRINALYFYGLERYPGDPERFPREVLWEMTNVPIHHTIVLSLSEVAEVIDILGGLPVTVPTAFTDTTFPRPNVDVAVERDPAKLYQTVEFQTGPQVFTGERALQYIRSRHSEGEEGGDGARSVRQQLVLFALMERIQDPQLLSNPTVMGTLFRYYVDHWQQYLSVPELISLAKALRPYQASIAFSTQQLPVYPEDPQGVVFHPPLSATNNQWIYRVRNAELFATTVRKSLGLEP